MKQQYRKAALVCALLAFCTGGCAKHEIVRQDQPLVPAGVVSSLQPPPPVTRAEARALTQGKDGQPTDSKGDGTGAPATGGAQTATSAPQSGVAGGTAGALRGALEKVMFDFDSYALSAKARESLTRNAEILKKGDVKVRIEGNCDELGSDEYNLALGERRAHEAIKYLETLGVPVERLTTVSYGKEKPAVAGHDAAARAANRRDEFVVTTK